MPHVHHHPTEITLTHKKKSTISQPDIIPTSCYTQLKLQLHRGVRAQISHQPLFNTALARFRVGSDGTHARLKQKHRFHAERGG